MERKPKTTPLFFRSRNSEEDKGKAKTEIGRKKEDKQMRKQIKREKGSRLKDSRLKGRKGAD